jgi:hypothetical protein
MAPKEQAELIRELAGIDLSDLDERRAEAFDKRRDVNRSIKSKRAQIDAMEGPFADVPTEEISIAELTAELDRRHDEQRQNEEQRRKLYERLSALDAEKADAGAAERAVERAREALNVATRRRDEALQAVKAAEQSAGELADVCDELVDPDMDEIRERLASVEETNRKIRANQKADAALDDLTKLDVFADELTGKIEELDEERAERLAEAKLPLGGLAFDGDEITLDGSPLEQASQAEQLRLSVAMGVAMNPELRVMLIRDGSLLDSESLQLIADIADESDSQVWIERVSEDGAGCSVVIEDGQIKASPEETQENGTDS